MSQYHSADFAVKTLDQMQWETMKEKVCIDQHNSGNQRSDPEVTALGQPLWSRERVFMAGCCVREPQVLTGLR